MALSDFLRALLDGSPQANTLASAPTIGSMAPGIQPNDLRQIAGGQGGTTGPVGTAAYQDALTRLFQAQGTPQAAATVPSGNPGLVRNDQGASANYSPIVNGRPPVVNGQPAATGPAPSGSASGGGFGNVIGGFLQDLIDPQARARNQTVDWLQRQGLDAGTATLYAGDKTLLRQYLASRAAANGPEEALKMEKLGLELKNLRNPTTDDIR
jgi:hypothetical protein